jgi:hypothetical protein
MIRAMMLLWLAQNPVLRLPSEAPPMEEAGPANLDFETGDAGEVPPDWSLTQASRVAGYRVELRREGCRSGSGCAVISSSPKLEKGAAGGLIQQFPAVRYHGQLMRLRVWVKLQGQQRGDGVRVAFTTDGEGGGDSTYIQKGGRVTASEWTMAEVEGKVPWRAELIHLVVSVQGKGGFWIDDVSFEEVGAR